MINVNASKTEFISNVRINTLVQTLASELEISRPLRFLNRTEIVDVLDDADILGSYSGTIYAADLITNDAKAEVVDSGKFEMTARVAAIPNIKVGARVGQNTIGQLAQMSRNIELSGSNTSLITGWENQLAQNLITGVRQTMNYLCASMMLDGIVYDKLGVKISAGFGTPSELKQTLVGGRVWSTPNVATMKPIEDLQYMSQSVAPALGKSYDRVTMATATFQKIIASDEFAERVRLYLRLDPDQFSLNIYDVPNMSNMFTAITGLALELEDATFVVKNSDGSDTVQRVLPENKVLLSNSSDDNDSSKSDFANGIVEETVVAQFIEGAPQFGGPSVGPVSYYRGNWEMNPPDLRAWAVAKGLPRRHDKYLTAILTVF